MTAVGPTWPCRHEPACYTDLEHLERCGQDVSDETWSDPMCLEHGYPGPDCDACNREREDLADWEGPLVRDEVVVKQKPGHVVVQLSEEALKALRMLGEPYDDPDTYAHARGRACVLLARDLADVLKEPPC